MSKSQAGPVSAGLEADVFCTKVEWKICDMKNKVKEFPKGQSLWSPEFSAAGLGDLQLEFYPCGRESASMEGFCSLFLWCPENTNIKYELSVGSHRRAADDDVYETRMGHGHSNFCLLSSEVDPANDSVTVGLEILEVRKDINFGHGLRVFRPSLSQAMERHLAVVANRHIGRVEWKIPNIANRLKNVPRGASMYSPVFSVAGIRDMMIEFYPNGNANTVKDGFCSLYLRCPEGTQIFVTLSVGDIKKGPISVRFEGSSGKGLPDFCLLAPQITDGAVTVAIEVRNPSLEMSSRHHDGEPPVTLTI